MAARARGDLHIRPFLGELRAWKAAARREGETLTDWIRTRLNELATPEPTRPVPPLLLGVKRREGFMRTDEELAAIFFDEQIAPGLRASGTPDEGVSHLRKSYVAGALANAEAMRQIHKHYGPLIAVCP